MHSENTNARFTTHSCHFCPEQGVRRTPGPVDGSCVRMESGIAPFPKELGIDGAPRQVYDKEIQHPCYSWVDVRTPRWVREIRRECGCVQRWYYPELLHPFNGGHVLKVRGQRYFSPDQHYGDPREWDDVHGHCTRRRVSFRHHGEQHSPGISRQSSPGKPQSNGENSAFFPTEVPSSKLGRSRLQVNGSKREIRSDPGSVAVENHGNQRKSQGTVREQIKQVVNELEEVLGGLKQVQLEMKEVVQQIDVLTSHIDLDEEETSPSNGLSQDASRSSRTDVVALIHYSNGEEDTTSDSSLAHSPVDLVHNNSPSPMRNHISLSSPEQRPITVEDKDRRVAKQTSETQRTQRTLNGNCLPHRTARKGQLENHRPPVVPIVYTNSNKTHRPPPYPQNGQLKMRTPPYPGKHKMLSSTVV
ncbi:protein Largen [Pimephales promelas]|nr:protein Largen [Pimephales promelas]